VPEFRGDRGELGERLFVDGPSVVGKARGTAAMEQLRGEAGWLVTGDKPQAGNKWPLVRVGAQRRKQRLGLDREAELAGGDVQRLEEDALRSRLEAALGILDGEQPLARRIELGRLRRKQPHKPRLGVVRRRRPARVVEDLSPAVHVVAQERLRFALLVAVLRRRHLRLPEG
jgi:hypothetical protein